MLHRMNRWDELTGPIAQRLREILHEAANVAHTENGLRFDPEELGDDALIYGLSTTKNARYLAAQGVDDAGLEDVHVCERGRIWWLEVQRGGRPAVRVYFYKAPPAARSLLDVRFDDAEIKKELGTSNGRQLELFNRSGEDGNAELLNVVVVHFGDPVAGLEKLEVGAPFIFRDEVAWDWYERFDEIEDAAAESPVEEPALGDDGKGFEGLRLVAEDEADDAQDTEEEMERGTSEFEALGLREDQDDQDQETDADQEQQ